MLEVVVQTYRLGYRFACEPVGLTFGGRVVLSKWLITVREEDALCLVFSSRVMIESTFCSIFLSRSSSRHFGPRLFSRRDRLNLRHSSVTRPSLYCSSGSAPRFLILSCRAFTRRIESWTALLRRVTHDDTASLLFIGPTFQKKQLETAGVISETGTKPVFRNPPTDHNSRWNSLCKIRVFLEGPGAPGISRRTQRENAHNTLTGRSPSSGNACQGPDQ